MSFFAKEIYILLQKVFFAKKPKKLQDLGKLGKFGKRGKIWGKVGEKGENEQIIVYW